MRTSNFDKIKKYFSGSKKPLIQEIVREPTAGGVIFRRNKKGEAEFLLYQDARDRWTIPKGHIEPGETAQVTARREIGEETGLKKIELHGWLGEALQNGSLHLLQAPLLDISSSDIRGRLKNGLDAAEMLDGNVWHYIRKHKLYAA